MQWGTMEAAAVRNGGPRGRLMPIEMRFRIEPRSATNK